MTLFIFAFLLGFVSGLRSMTPIAAVSIGAFVGHIKVEKSFVAFLAESPAPYVLSVLALAELVFDKLRFTPSRKATGPFLGRILTGALCGAAIGASEDLLVVTALVGALGAVFGTLGGSSARESVAASFKKDWPAALIEDAFAICGAALLVALA
ncbi:MAG: DUF4126 family protein [Polyangiaceae bacterium]